MDAVGYGLALKASTYPSGSNEWHYSAPVTAETGNSSWIGLNDGKALQVGGGQGTSTSLITKSYDPTSNTWTNKANTIQTYEGAQLALLMDGRVWAYGGEAANANQSSNGSVYDPIANTWTNTAYPDSNAANNYTGYSLAVGLADGRAMLHSYTSFSPTGYYWFYGTTGSPFVWTRSSAKTLGTVLTGLTRTDVSNRIFGMGDDGTTATYYEYNEASATLTAKASHGFPRNNFIRYSPCNDKIIAVNRNPTDWPTSIYDPVTNVWTSLKPRYSMGGTSTVIGFGLAKIGLSPNAKVLAQGGDSSNQVRGAIFNPIVNVVNTNLKPLLAYLASR